MNNEFDNIRAYGEQEFSAALSRVLDNQEFRNLVQGVCHYQLHDTCTADDLINPMRAVKTQQELDYLTITKGLNALAAMTCDGVSMRGADNLRLPALFLSNHRDIILDAAFLSMLVREATGKRIYFGAGTNLYVQSWVEDMLRLNNGFAVIRGGSVHEMIRNSQQLSAYIRMLVCEVQSGVWLAQREGRAKNSDDRTQPALLKMLTLSGDGSFIQRLRQLNITPVAISYEYDPCDYLKAQEMILKRDIADWKKTPQDDFHSMRTGMLGRKGKTVFTVTPSINAELDDIEQLTANKNEQAALVAQTIDRHIHANYCIYNVNRIAYDLYLGKHDFSDQYTADEVSAFEAYISAQLGKIQLPDGKSVTKDDAAWLRTHILEMYANPLINHLNSH